MKTATGRRQRSTVPKRRQKHHSSDESVDEPAKLIEKEPAEIEEETPAEENEPQERANENNNPEPPAFEE
jgi:hypothetical protein